MKTKQLFAVVMTVAFMLTSCGSTTSTTNALSALTGQSQQSEAYTSGQSAGVALRALYTQYKTNGKLDMSNLGTLTQILTLTNSCKTLKSVTKGTGAYSDFSKGLIAGSSNLVNNNNSEKIVTNLTNVLTKVDTTSISQVVNKSNSVVSNAVEKGATALENATEKGSELMEDADAIVTSVQSILGLFK